MPLLKFRRVEADHQNTSAYQPAQVDPLTVNGVMPSEGSSGGNAARTLETPAIQIANPGIPMILSNRNASSDSVESLRESLASMEQQLASLYAEQEFKKGLNFSGDETLAALYEDKQRLSARTIADLRESVESLSAQLADVYAQREATPDNNQSALLATIDGLTQQLHDLYEERELSQIGLGHAEARADAGLFSGNPGAAHPSSAKDESRYRDMAEMAESLTEQVAALLEERNDLVRKVDGLKADLGTAKRRARDMIDALVAQSLD